MSAKGEVIHVTDENFGKTIGQGVVLVDFWAPWCGPCRMQGPILEDLVKEIGDKAIISKLNVDENPQAAGQFGVTSIPTLIVFKDGEPAKQFIGVQDAATLKKTIEELA